MNLGERIYELRSRAGLSQGELADRLDVSRQAVSKWENNSAVPELDKLLKMSELFEISLDGLVKGEAKEEKEEKEGEEGEAPVNEASAVVISSRFPPRKIAAVVLFGMAFLTALVLSVMGGIGGLLYSLPFLIFGLICWFCERHTGLKCLWAALFMINAFCRWATGISVAAVRYTFSWTYQMNYGILAASWALVLFNAFVVIYTVVKLGKEAPENPGRVKKSMLISFAALASVIAVNQLIGMLTGYLYEDVFSDGYYMHAFSFVLSTVGALKQYAFEIVLALALTAAIRYKRLIRKAK